MPLLNFEKIEHDRRQLEQIGGKDIYIIKNFLTEEEQITLYEKLEALTNEDFKKSYIEKQLKPQAMQRYGTDDIDALVANGTIKDIEAEFNMYWSDKVFFLDDIDENIKHNISARLNKYLEEGYTFNGLSTVQRHGKGQFLGYHYDDAHQKDIKFAVAVYINDNYEGGELHFPPEEDLIKIDQGGDWELTTDALNGIVIKPTKRDLAVFATTGDYVHGVRPVLSDDYRYAIVTFIR